MSNELKHLVEIEGITSVKLYMTYKPLKLGDGAILDIMMVARSLGITTMIHAENSDMISLITGRLEQKGLTEPYHHAVSRPQLAEGEATYRAISLAELTDVPILLVHVSSEIAMDHIRDAQTRLLPIHGETCPHYLYLLSQEMKAPNFEGAKHVCSPPLRHDPKDLDVIWKGVANGTFTTLSSDHSPTTFDGPFGKKVALSMANLSSARYPTVSPESKPGCRYCSTVPSGNPLRFLCLGLYRSPAVSPRHCTG
jgi:dihydropyrimidinase